MMRHMVKSYSLPKTKKQTKKLFYESFRKENEKGKEKNLKRSKLCYPGTEIGIKRDRGEQCTSNLNLIL